MIEEEDNIFGLLSERTQKYYLLLQPNSDKRCHLPTIVSLRFPRCPQLWATTEGEGYCDGLACTCLFVVPCSTPVQLNMSHSTSTVDNNRIMHNSRLSGTEALRYVKEQLHTFPKKVSILVHVCNSDHWALLAGLHAWQEPNFFSHFSVHPRHHIELLSALTCHAALPHPPRLL